MKTVSIISVSGKKAGTVELPDEVFDVQANVPLIHQVVVAQQAAARQGTHATRTRGQMRGGGKKPYRQKGTGRARQGSIRAPQYVGGGTVHGPVPRSYQQRTPKKMKAAALRGALSERARHDRVHVVSGFVESGPPKTKDAVAVLSALTGTRGGAGALVVAHRDDELTWLSLRNVAGVHVLAADQLNTYDVLASDHVVFTEQALTAFLGAAPERAAEDEAATDEAADDEAATSRTVKEEAATDEAATSRTVKEEAAADVAEDEAAADEASQDEVAADQADQDEAPGQPAGAPVAGRAGKAGRAGQARRASAGSQSAEADGSEPDEDSEAGEDSEEAQP
jgi:large subunit ribosomal protein L4